MGFADAARAELLLLNDVGATAAELRADPLVTAIAAAADPDLALTGLARLFGVAATRKDALLAALRAEQDFRERLTAVLGVSSGLADHLARHPEDAEILRGAVARPEPAELRAEMLRAVGAHANDSDGPVAVGPEPAAALAAAYRRRLLHLAARDLTGAATVDVVGEELADIAAAVLEAALAVARSELAPGAAPGRLAVVAMGKCGGRELNYASDVDVIFVAEPVKDEDETAALATASKLAAGVIGVCARSTPEGSIFPVDPNLRPEGRAGPLVRTLASHRAYYERSARRTPTRSARSSGRRPAAKISSRTCRPCAAGWSSRCPPGRPGASSSSDPAGCATSSSPSSCCSSCTAAPTRHCARPRRCPRWPRWPRAATSAGPTRRNSVPPTGSCAAPSTCCSSAGSAAPIPCPRTPPYFAGWAGRCVSMRARTSRGSRPRSPGSAPTRRPTSTRSGAATPA